MLSYRWRVIYSPSDSVGQVIEDNGVPRCSFKPDVEGYYTLGLKVFDGKHWSDEAEAYIKVGDVPYAHGLYAHTDSEPLGTLADVTDKFFVGNAVELSASHAGAYPLNSVTDWKVLEQPEGETATLSQDRGNSVVYSRKWRVNTKLG